MNEIEQYCYKHNTCNNCKYNAMEQMEQALMFEMNDINRSNQYHCEEEEEYEGIKKSLEYYMNVVECYLEDDVSGHYNYCNNCKSKERVEKFKEYFDKMIKIINSQRYYYGEKLQRIYFLQDDYHEDCTGFFAERGIF